MSQEFVAATPEQVAGIQALPCDMYTQDPYPFAWCETHDETFPLGGVCRFYKEEGETR
ncbi:hypothetical protein [Nocardia sp. NPDC004260]